MSPPPPEAPIDPGLPDLENPGEGWDLTQETKTPVSGLVKRWPLLAEEGRVPVWPIYRNPDNHDFVILEETDDYAVINKPAPLMIHPGKPGDPPTLWDDLRDLFVFEMANGGNISLINRLDRETSGLVLAAKHKKAAREMAGAMQARQTVKTYLAIVWGWPSEDTFTINGPIERQGRKMPSRVWLKRCVHPEGQDSQTNFRVLGRWEQDSTNGRFFSLLEASPVTGRMHQIRVHAAHAGFPIVGDKLYGQPGEDAFLEFIDTGWTDLMHRRLIHHRQALHAWKLTIPWQEGTLSFRAPLPDDLRRLIPEEIAAPL